MFECGAAAGWRTSTPTYFAALQWPPFETFSLLLNCYYIFSFDCIFDVQHLPLVGKLTARGAALTSLIKWGKEKGSI